MGEYVLLAFAAQITTLSVIAYHFNCISLVTFLVNPLILPAQPPLMILGGLALLVGLVTQPLGQLLAYLAWPFVVFTIRVVEFSPPFPAPCWNWARVALALILLYYALHFAWTFARPSLRARLASLKPGTALLGLGLVTVLVWRNFRTLLPTGLDEDLCQSLLEEPGAMPVNALLLASSGAGDLNPPDWLPAWDQQLVLLSVASGNRRPYF